ncbi:hypothetical protein ACH5RR_008964 [Cinchona calisaya]|uniref:SWIM-type domain-containing protein n=1 Tax=Cinchona calisaya TaxID=153742 RepID=A0ABD3AFU7_9GENT
MWTLEVHYNSHFDLKAEMVYVDGNVVYFPQIDPDFMSIIELREILEQLLLPIDMPIYYKVPDGEYRRVTNNDNVMEMFGMYRDTEYLVLYVNNVNVGNLQFPNFWGDEEAAGVGHMGNVGNVIGDHPVMADVGGVIGDYPVMADVGGNVGGYEDSVAHSGDKIGELAWASSSVGGVNTSKLIDVLVRGDEGNWDLSDDSDDTYVEETNSSTDADSDLGFFLDGDSLSDTCDPIEDVENVESSNLNNELGEYAEYAEMITDDYMSYINKKKYGKFAESEHVTDQEVLEEAIMSSDDESGNDFPKFNEDTDMDNPNIIVGLVFPTGDVYRKVVRMYSIKKGFELKFKKNDPGKISAYCSSECGWKIYASYFRGTKAIQVKSIYGTPHRCPWSYKNRSANANWLSNQFLHELHDDPNWELKGFMKAVKRKFSIYITKPQAYRAKKMALQTIQGQHKDQYLRLRDYCATIMSRNLGSAAYLVADRVAINRNPIFKRMFVMFSAQKIGLEACRPVIGLDACHLRGAFGGHLLHVVARDANNQMYPVAMAVVEAECKDSWSWFLDVLTGEIGAPEDKGWVFISDRQKGLVETFETKFPNVEHRFCMRHLYANFKLRFKDKALRDILWAAARAYTVDAFHRKMSLLHTADRDAHKWLSEIPPNLWARCFFSTRTKCDLLSNNISECFNKYINNAKDEPIYTMFEDIRRMIMCRYQEKKEWVAKVNADICPKIHDIVEQNKSKSIEYDPHKAAEGLWEIATLSGNHVVSFSSSSCTCREWDMTGIPCVHACSAIMHDRKKEVFEFVNPYYSKKYYKQTYAEVIIPIPDPNLWINSNGHPTDPPILRKRPGRPKNLRKKSVDEVLEQKESTQRVTRKGHTYTCSNCLQQGHNAKGCKNPEHPNKKKKNPVQDQGNRGTETTEPSQTPLAGHGAGIGEATHTSLAGQETQHSGVRSSSDAGRNTVDRGNRGTTKVSRRRGRGRWASQGAETGERRFSFEAGRGTVGRENRSSHRWGKIYGGRDRSRGDGPLCGIGLWNGIGISTMSRFIHHSPVPTNTSGQQNVQPTFLWTNSSQSGSTISANQDASTSVDTLVQIERHQTRFGGVLFSNQTSSVGVQIQRDNGGPRIDDVTNL